MILEIFNFPDHYKGDTFDSITFTVKEDGVPVDLTGVAIKMDFRKNSYTGNLKESKTLGSGLTLVDAINGKFQLDKYINDWDSANYYYDAQITFSVLDIRTYFKGRSTVTQDSGDE
tara:strand:- start:975 stop:1322 length:348 start_codon:yes stop_codon:yes gene_type:complete